MGTAFNPLGVFSCLFRNFNKLSAKSLVKLIGNIRYPRVNGFFPVLKYHLRKNYNPI